MDGIDTAITSGLMKKEAGCIALTKLGAQYAQDILQALTPTMRACVCCYIMLSTKELIADSGITGNIHTQ